MWDVSWFVWFGVAKTDSASWKWSEAERPCKGDAYELWVRTLHSWWSWWLYWQKAGAQGIGDVSSPFWWGCREFLHDPHQSRIECDFDSHDSMYLYLRRSSFVPPSRLVLWASAGVLFHCIVGVASCADSYSYCNSCCSLVIALLDQATNYWQIVSLLMGKTLN